MKRIVLCMLALAGPAASARADGPAVMTQDLQRDQLDPQERQQQELSSVKQRAQEQGDEAIQTAGDILKICGRVGTPYPDSKTGQSSFRFNRPLDPEAMKNLQKVFQNKPGQADLQLGDLVEGYGGMIVKLGKTLDEIAAKEDALKNGRAGGSQAEPSAAQESRKSFGEWSALNDAAKPIVLGDRGGSLCTKAVAEGDFCARLAAAHKALDEQLSAMSRYFRIKGAEAAKLAGPADSKAAAGPAAGHADKLAAVGNHPVREAVNADKLAAYNSAIDGAVARKELSESDAVALKSDVDKEIQGGRFAMKDGKYEHTPEGALKWLPGGKQALLDTTLVPSKGKGQGFDTATSKAEADAQVEKLIAQGKQVAALKESDKWMQADAAAAAAAFKDRPSPRACGAFLGGVFCGKNEGLAGEQQRIEEQRQKLAERDNVTRGKVEGAAVDAVNSATATLNKAKPKAEAAAKAAETKADDVLIDQMTKIRNNPRLSSAAKELAITQVKADNQSARAEAGKIRDKPEADYKLAVQDVGAKANKKLKDMDDAETRLEESKKLAAAKYDAVIQSELERARANPAMLDKYLPKDIRGIGNNGTFKKNQENDFLAFVFPKDEGAALKKDEDGTLKKSIAKCRDSMGSASAGSADKCLGDALNSFVKYRSELLDNANRPQPAAPAAQAPAAVAAQAASAKSQDAVAASRSWSSGSGSSGGASLDSGDSSKAAAPAKTASSPKPRVAAVPDAAAPAEQPNNDPANVGAYADLAGKTPPAGNAAGAPPAELTAAPAPRRPTPAPMAGPAPQAAASAAAPASVPRASAHTANHNATVRTTFARCASNQNPSAACHAAAVEYCAGHAGAVGCSLYGQ